METALNIFREVTTAYWFYSRNILLNLIEICSEIMNAESRFILNISVADKAHSNLKFWVVSFYIIDDFFQCVLRSLDP